MEFVNTVGAGRCIDSISIGIAHDHETMRQRYHHYPSGTAASTTATTAAANDNVNRDEGSFESDDDDDDYDDDKYYDHPYHETACEWYHRHVLRRARRLAGITSSSDTGSCSSSSSCCSSSSSVDMESEVEEGFGKRNYHNDDFYCVGDGGMKNNDESKRLRNKKIHMKRKAIRSAQRPLARWLTTYPVVAARCCLSLDSSLATTSRADARATNITTTFAVTNIGTSYNTTPVDHEALRLGRVFRRLHQKKMKYDNSANNANSSSPSSVIEHTNDTLDQQLMRIKQEISDTTSHWRIVHSFLPQGTGISFIDAVLGGESLLTPPTSKSALLECKKKEQAADQTTSRLALELNGPRRSGMTSILLAVAARYVACTSIAMLFDNGCHAKDTGRGPHRMHDDDYKSTTMKKCKVNDTPTPRSIEPRVVILDLEKGVHAIKLALSVREAVLRRWEETAPARQWNREQERQWAIDGAEEERHNTTITSEADDDEDGEKFNTTMNEQRQIELAIASCLGRINIVQPRDCTHLSLLATLEELRHSLDEERDAAKRKPSTDGASSSTQHVEAPTLIMIDSLTALDASTRYLESLPTNAGSKGSARSGGSGLSDRNEFYRQLMRLQNEHEIAILGTSTCSPSSFNNSRLNDQTTRVGGKRVSGSSSSLWENMVSHRFSLHHAAEGTQECQAGYDFVATLTTKGRQEDTRVFPYSITAGGIAC